MKHGRYIKLRTHPSLTSIYPIYVEFSAVHWGERPWTADGFYSDGSLRYRGVQHDAAPRPWQWPWWRLAVFSAVDLNVQLPSTGKRLWIYTRWGALHTAVFIDRRGGNGSAWS